MGQGTAGTSRHWALHRCGFFGLCEGQWPGTRVGGMSGGGGGDVRGGGTLHSCTGAAHGCQGSGEVGFGSPPSPTAPSKRSCLPTRRQPMGPRMALPMRTPPSVSCTDCGAGSGVCYEDTFCTAILSVQSTPFHRDNVF